MQLVIRQEFREDLKRYKKRKQSTSDIWKIVQLLQSGRELPGTLRAKRLKEPYQDFFGCHIKADLILIYRVEENRLTLYRLGSHRELYQHDK